MLPVQTTRIAIVYTKTDRRQWNTMDLCVMSGFKCCFFLILYVWPQSKIFPLCFTKSVYLFIFSVCVCKTLVHRCLSMSEKNVRSLELELHIWAAQHWIKQCKGNALQKQVLFFFFFFETSALNWEPWLQPLRNLLLNKISLRIASSSQLLLGYPETIWFKLKT